MNRSEKDANNMEILFSGAVGEWIRRYKGVSDFTCGQRVRVRFLSFPSF